MSFQAATKGNNQVEKTSMPETRSQEEKLPAKIAREVIELLWNNLGILSEKVAPELMAPEILETHIKRRSPLRPLQIAAWLARQGYFVAAWAWWEHYSTRLCKAMPNIVEKTSCESTVEWVRKSLAANGKDRVEYEWFSNAICLRNLIAHHGARAAGSRAVSLLDRARRAFPGLETGPDGYVTIRHDDAAELQNRIVNFIEDTE
jgi:hypothetical protein